MRLLFMGDLSATGFGTVTTDLGRALLDRGEDVRFVSQNEIGELPEPFASRTYAVNDPDGWLALMSGIAGLLDGTYWSDGWTAEAVLILGDYDAVRAIVERGSNAEAFRDTPTYHYVPIEGHDLPPSWALLWRLVHPVAMSEFGADQIARITGIRPPVVYHGIDTDAFYPVSKDRPITLTAHPDPDQEPIVKVVTSKAECKAFFKADPKFKWLYRCDRLMTRKRYPSLLRALAPVLMARNDTHLVTHCRSDDLGGNLFALFSKYPPEARRHMFNTGFHDVAQGASREIMAALYNASDIYVSVSSEGFGLTIAEAIACGVPAVGLDYSAVPEVIGPAGITVPPAVLIDNEYDHFWAGVDERAYGNAVAGLLADDVKRARLGKEGPPHVVANFSWHNAAEQFATLIHDRELVAA